MRPTGNCSPALDERLTDFLAVLPLPRPDMPAGLFGLEERSWSVLGNWLMLIAAQSCDKNGQLRRTCRKLARPGQSVTLKPLPSFKASRLAARQRGCGQGLA
jgi:hypothetical protein